VGFSVAENYLTAMVKAGRMDLDEAARASPPTGCSILMLRSVSVEATAVGFDPSFLRLHEVKEERQ
jgi:hypothetical protein